MMSCAAFDGQLEHYLTARLAEEDATSLEAHAAECERCGAILEARTRLTIGLVPELVPDPRHRVAVLSQIAKQPHGRRRAQWFFPTAIAAALLLSVSLMRPGTKSGQGGPLTGSPAALAAERADGQFRQLDAARTEDQARYSAS